MSEPTGEHSPEAQGQADLSANSNGVGEPPIVHGTPAPEPVQDETSVLRASLERAHQEVEKSREVYLRLAAEMENLRRRTAEEVSKAHKFAIESFAESVLPVRDSLEAALAQDNQTLDSLHQGVSATLRILEAAFERGKVVAISPVAGDKFDPNAHQAVAMVPGASVEPLVPSQHVVAVLQKGYVINDRVLRPALVSVAQ